MRQSRRHLALFAALTLGAVCAFAGSPTHAQNLPGTPPAAAAPSTTKGLAKVVAGVKAYKASKMDLAVTTLTKAMTEGGLSSTDLAKALYYRGLAYRRKQQPAEAIADLTSAIWLKRGLNETERQDAEKNRTAAYAEAGIQDPGASITRSAGPPPTSTPPAAGGWKTATKSGQARTSSPPQPQPTPTGPATVSVAPNTSPSPSPVPVALAPAPTPTPTAPTAGTPASNPLAGVGTFFSNLFGGTGSTSTGSATPAPTPPVVATGTLPQAVVTPAPVVAPENPALLATPSTGPVSAVSAWSSKTQVSSQKTAARTKTAATTPQQPKAAPGRYSIRVAALRSRDAAQKLVTMLQAHHAPALGGRKPQIETESFGNMGTFYNVQVGPFARPTDYAALCTAARADGLDCQVLKK